MAGSIVAAGIVVSLAAALAGLCDLLTFRIPNWIVIGLVLAFALAASFSGLTPSDLAVHIATGIAVLLVGLGGFALGWCGGGDAKLAGALGLWFGFPSVVDFLAITAIAGGAMALGAVLMRRRAVLSAGSGLVRLVRRWSASGDIPYGVAMAIAAIVSIFFIELPTA